MNSVSLRNDEAVPPPSILSDELVPATTIGIGGLALDTPWLRGPVVLAEAAVGVEALSGRWRMKPRGPLRWWTPAVQCVACLDGTSHADYETYAPARQYREIAADFLRLIDDRGVHEFTQDWGMVRLHRRRPHPIGHSERHWTRAWPHDEEPDFVDEVLHEAGQARAVYGAAYQMDEAEQRRGYDRVVAVIRTMETRFASDGLVVEAVPSSLLHLVYFALHGLYKGAGRLLCGEWQASGCPAVLPSHHGRGRPRLYCSDRCAWRARNRRRRRGVPSTRC